MKKTVSLVRQTICVQVNTDKIFKTDLKNDKYKLTATFHLK